MAEKQPVQYIGPDPTRVGFKGCLTESLYYTALELFPKGKFDYTNTAEGYVTKYPKGSYKLGQMTDFNVRGPSGDPIFDNKPDVYCIGLVDTPAHAIGANPHAKTIFDYEETDINFEPTELSDLNIRIGDVFRIEDKTIHFQHTGFITGMIETEDRYVFYVFHSMQTPIGPTLGDRLVVDKNTLTVQIILAGSTTPIDRFKVRDSNADEQYIYVNDSLKLTNIWEPRCCSLKEKPDKTPPAPNDPLILDLDHNGIQTVGFDANVHFDYDANGFTELPGWVAEGSPTLFRAAPGQSMGHKQMADKRG